MSSLGAAMRAGSISAEPLARTHREALKRVCAADADIWHIYPRNFGPDGFDEEFDALLANDWVRFALFDDARLVGMSSFIGINPEAQLLEIGATYIAPEARGTGFNRRVKDMMIRRARDCGFQTVLFRIDARNQRSQAAVRKLGAQLLRIDEKDRTTWTGFVRDTAVYQLDTADWAG